MRVKSSILLLMMILVTIASTAITFTEAKNSTKVRFRAFASGPCGIGYGETQPFWPDCSTGWCGIGKGSAGISGLAEVVSLEGGFFGEDVYVSERLRFRGFIYISWTEEDDSKHELFVVLYPDKNTKGIFIPDMDWFSIPQPGPGAEAYVLRFKGLHICDSKIQKIGGGGLFWTVDWPLNPEESPVPIIMAYLVDEESGISYAVMWLAEELKLPPDSPIDLNVVPAAKVFHRNVELIGAS